MNKRLNTNFLNTILQNPIMPAAGTFNSGIEVDFSLFNIDILGALVTKSITIKKRFGNNRPRICDTKTGILSTMGIGNDGIDLFIKQELNFLKRKSLTTKIIINIGGFEIEDFIEVILKLNQFDFIFAYEINASCPTIDNSFKFLKNKELFVQLVKECRRHTKKPVIIKLSNEGKEITDLAVLAEKNGANAVSLTNGIQGLRINLDSRNIYLSNLNAGYTGQAIKPIAIKMVYDIYKLINIPIIGIGGIQDEYDVIEFMMAGASCVQIGTQNFINPLCMKEIIEKLPAVLDKYKIDKISDIIGIANSKE